MNAALFEVNYSREKMLRTEDSEDSPKRSEDDVYSLRNFVNGFSLPKKIQVVEGYHGMSGAEEETLGAGEILTLHTVRNIQKVQAQSVSGEVFEIPLQSPIVVEKIDDRFRDELHGLTELLNIPTDVKFVRVTQIDPYFGSKVSPGEKLKIKRKVRGEKDDFIEFIKLNKESSAKTCHRIKLPLNCKVTFQLLEDGQEYLLSDFIKKIHHFPVLAKAIDNDTNRILLKKAIQSSYFGILKFNGVLEKPTVIGTTLEGDGVSVLTIPIELDISVTQANEIETDCTSLERRKNETLFEAIESKIYENLGETSVLRRKHNIECIYEEMEAGFGQSKQQKDNRLEIKNRNPASPNAYSPRPKGTTEKSHVDGRFGGTPTELVGSGTKVRKENPNLLPRSLSSPFITASGYSNTAMCNDFTYNLKSVPRKQDVSRDDNMEEPVYEEVKIIRPSRANLKPHEIKRWSSDDSNAKDLHKREGYLGFQPYEDMSAILTSNQTVDREEGLYQVVNVTAATNTSQFSQQRKETKANELRRLSNKNYENFASLQRYSSDKAKEIENTRPDHRSDSNAEVRRTFSACKRDPASSSNPTQDINSARAVEKPTPKHRPPVPQRTDSLAAKRKIPLVTDSSFHPQDSSEAEVTKNISTKVVSKKSSSLRPTTLTTGFEEIPVTENVEQKCEQTQNFDVDQKPVIPNKIKDENQKRHRKEFAYDAGPPLLPAKQGKLKPNADDLPAKKDTVFPASVKKNDAFAIEMNLSKDGQLQRCSANRLTERRGSCPETCKDYSRHGKEITRRGSERLQMRKDKETASAISHFELPEDLQSLNVSGVAQCLEALHMEQYVERFKSELIDGEMLMALNKEILETCLGLEQLHCLKLMKFIRGWRPKE